MQFIPARGRKPFAHFTHCYTFLLQFIPARGRKHKHLPQSRQTCGLQFIPARGRKLRRILEDKPKPDCNLSPRGDGNACARATCEWCWYCNLSPRGDGNARVAIPASSMVHCNLSPRGDGNRIYRGRSPESCQLQFIPARGRKRRRPAVCPPGITRLQFIPARGRKRPAQIRMGRQDTIAIYPREGTETRVSFLPILPIVIAIYPREGTETKCIRRRRGPWGLQFIPAKGRKP